MKKSRMTSATHFRTICEVLREIYWQSDDTVVKEKCMEATVMAKKMDAKLREYKDDWDADMWEPVDDEKVQRLRAERKK